MATQGIKFLYTLTAGNWDINNPGSNILSVTSTATGDFDKKNLTSASLREVWRSTSAVGWQEIIIQADDTVTIPDTFALLNHNLTSVAVVQLQASMTSDFLSPAFTIPMTWNKKHMVLLQSAGTAYNYYRIRILDPSNPCSFIQIGKIVIGKSLTITNNEDITDDISVAKQDMAYKIKTEGFFRASNERIKIDKLSVKFQKLLTDPGVNDNYLNLLSMIDNVGETYPFLTIVDSNDPYFQIVWGSIDALPTVTYTINRYADMSFAIQEVY